METDIRRNPASQPCHNFDGAGVLERMGALGQSPLGFTQIVSEGAKSQCLVASSCSISMQRMQVRAELGHPVCTADVRESLAAVGL